MDMLYFDDMPLDWQLSMLNNSQNGEDNIDLSLLNQISNDSENIKEILDLKLTDNQLEQFLTTMDQPLVNPYTAHKHVNTTQSINSMPTTTSMVGTQFTNNLENSEYLHNINQINDINLNMHNNSNEQQQLLQELINNKLNSMTENSINNYSSLLYNHNIINNDNNAYSIGTKRKEDMSDIVNNNTIKKLKKIPLIPDHTSSYAIPTTGINAVTSSSNLPLNNLDTDIALSMPVSVNNYTNELQPSSHTTTTHEQNQILMQLLDEMKNKEVTNTTAEAQASTNINHIIGSLIANSHQNMNSILTTPTTETLNMDNVPATTASAVVVEAVAQKQFISPTIINNLQQQQQHHQHQHQHQNQKHQQQKPPHQPLNQQPQISQHLQQTLQVARATTTTTTTSDNVSLPLSTTSIDTLPIKTTLPNVASTIDKTVSNEVDTATLLRKVKVEDSGKNENVFSNNDTISVSSTANHAVSSSISKFPLNSNVISSSTSSSSNVKLKSASWVKTQEKGEMKMAISRLKTNDPVKPIIPLQVIKHQKKVAHNAIERKYRNNINDRIKQLQDVIPALQYTKNIKEREKNQKDNKNGGDDDVVKIDESLIIDGIPAARKLNKATVLKSATDYIVHLKKTSNNLKEENKRLLDFIKKIGGDEMLNQFTKENSDLYEEEKASPEAAPTSKGKEKGKKKGKGKQLKPVQEASPPHIYSSDSPSPTHVNSPSTVSSSSNEDDATMLDVLSGERENPQNINNFNSNNSFTTLMVSLLIFSVGLFEYGSYLDNKSDSNTQYENYVVGSQGKVLLGRSEESSEPSIQQPAHPSFYQYIVSKFAKMDENIFVGAIFYLFLILIILMISKKIINYIKESRNSCISSIGNYSILDKLFLIEKTRVELFGFALSKVSRTLYEKLFKIKGYSYTKLLLSQCRMIERDILITKNQNKQSLLVVFYTTLQIINNIDFVTSEMSYSTIAYILYTTAIQYLLNFKDIPFGKAIAARIWKKGTYYVSKANEDKEDYERNLRQSKKFDDYKKKRKINIANEAIDFILTYVNVNPKTCEEFFLKGHWITFLDRNSIEMSTSLYDFSNQKCLLITFSTAFKYEVLLNTFKKHGLKYIYVAPSAIAKSGESTELETDSELENSNGNEKTLNKKQIKEEIKNDYFSLSNFYLKLSNYYLPPNYFISSLEAPLNKIMSKLVDKKSKKKEKEQNKIMKIDKILDTIVKVANSSLIVNDINLYWYTQILWIMVSWKKEYFKPIVSENNMDKINIQLFYADQFRKLIVTSVTSYYSDVVEDDVVPDEIPKANYSDDLYSYSSSELQEIEEEDDEGEEEIDSSSANESESEYVSEFKTETIPESTSISSVSTNSRPELGKAYQGIAKHYSVPNYSTVHFLSDSTRQFITLSLFTWLMVQKQKYTIAKRSIEKAHQILEKITNVSLNKDDFSFTSLFEEENDYYPDIMLKFERIVVILAGTWLVESERIILNNERKKNSWTNNTEGLSSLYQPTLESSSSKLTTATKAVSLVSTNNDHIVKKVEEEEEKEKEKEKGIIGTADEVVTLPKLSETTNHYNDSNESELNAMTKSSSVVPKISEFVERYVKLIHYFQELLPFIGSDTIAIECFKTVQHYQSDYRKYILGV